jgi:quinol monooxygenase YgiN
MRQIYPVFSAKIQSIFRQKCGECDHYSPQGAPSALSTFVSTPFAMRKTKPNLLIILTVCMLSTLPSGTASAQTDQRYMRIARIVVDSAQLENYRAALREGIETAVRVEPGVLSLYAVYDKAAPTHVTVFEIYADEAAYHSHIETPHFKKYKNTTKDMVKSLELIDVTPIALAAKQH